MKKILLATSAFAAVGLLAGTASAASKLKVEVNGYMEQYLGMSGQNADFKNNYTNNSLGAATGANFAHANIISDSEIHFNGSTKLDNGMTVGIHVELEGNSDPAGVAKLNDSTASSGTGTATVATGGQDFIDESYAYVNGGFGQLIIGSTGNAAYKMAVMAPDVGHHASLAESTTGGLSSWIVRPGSVALINTTALNRDGWAQKAIYFTPRFAGFQFGASLTPSYVYNANTTGSIVTSSVAGMEDSRGLGNVNTAPNVGSYAGAFGLNYANTFNGLGVRASAGYYHERASHDWGRMNVAATNVVNDYHDWDAGLNLSYAGFTVGGSYRNVTQKDGNGDAFGVDGYAYDFGIGYDMGPMHLTLTTLQSRAAGMRNSAPAGAAANTVNSGKDKTAAYQLGARYTLGPGVDAMAAMFYTKYQDEAYVSGTATPEDMNKGTGTIVGLALTF